LGVTLRLRALRLESLAGPTASDVAAPHGSSMQARTRDNCNGPATPAARVTCFESASYAVAPRA